ncbi:hypothetical protein ACVWYF_001444 [Hymenobacter sp. UYAg731]
MHVIAQTDWPSVVSACAQANGLLQDPAFFAGIAAHPSFDEDAGGPPTRVGPAQIAAFMQQLPLAFSVSLFTPRGPIQRIKYFKTQAYTDPGQPDTLFLNSRWLAQKTPPMAEIAATIIHECVHAADEADPVHDFGHGDNSSVGKQNTAPYWIGNYAYRCLGGPQPGPLNFDEATQ